MLPRRGLSCAGGLFPSAWCVPLERRLAAILAADVVVEDGDLLGDGVNVAARLEALAEPAGVCISGSVYDQVRGKVKTRFEDIGRQPLKNIAELVQVYRIRPDAPAPDGENRPAGATLPLPVKPSIA